MLGLTMISIMSPIDGGKVEVVRDGNCLYCELGEGRVIDIEVSSIQLGHSSDSGVVYCNVWFIKNGQHSFLFHRGRFCDIQVVTQWRSLSIFIRVE